MRLKIKYYINISLTFIKKFKYSVIIFFKLDKLNLE